MTDQKLVNHAQCYAWSKNSAERDLLKAAFIAGADWQQAQFDADRETHLLVRDHNTIVSQSATILSQQVEIERYELAHSQERQQVGKLESQIAGLNDRVQARDEKIAAQEAVIEGQRRIIQARDGMIDKLTAERDDWQKTATKLAEQLHDARHERTRHADRAKAQAAAEMYDETDVMKADESGLKAMWDDIPTEATGGFTAQGETESDQVRNLKVELDAVKDHLKFYKALSAARAGTNRHMCQMVDDLIALIG